MAGFDWLCTDSSCTTSVGRDFYAECERINMEMQTFELTVEVNMACPLTR